MGKLNTEEIVTIQVLKQKGESNRAIARRLGVVESVVRYHLKRKTSGAKDGRKKQLLIEKLELTKVVKHWWQSQLDVLPEGRSPNINGLWLFLKEEHSYSGSYKSVRKYVREAFPKPKLRSFRRVETPPGAQAQSDWMEVKVDIGYGLQKVYGFIMTLSHSRKKAVVWSLSMDQLAWHRVHNEAFKRLDGVAAINRIDNLKTGVAHGAGPWGKINESYQAYARTMGFHVDPHEVRQPQQKGKAERGVSSVRKMLDLKARYDSLAAFQAYTDEQLLRDAKHRKCPVTGTSVHATWLEEAKLLRQLPALLPEPFDLVRTCAVHKDCTIRFEGRTYSVPFKYAYGSVEVRGCSGFIQVVDRGDGQIIKQYPRKTGQLLFVDNTCYEGESTAEVASPRRLGRVARKLEEISELPVQLRSIEIYAQLAGVCR
ncbi:IS21 family transposase [bacterium]|nr:IS21 family transposase [bacterium]